MRALVGLLSVVVVVLGVGLKNSQDHVSRLDQQLNSARLAHQEAAEELDIANLNLTAEECFKQTQTKRKDQIRSKLLQVQPEVKEPVITEVVEAVHKYSLQYELDPDLILAVALEESDFNPKAVSGAGAIGIMQVMPLWVDQLDFVASPGELLNIDKNIHAGSFILRFYTDLYRGNRKMSLLAYNRGQGAILRSIEAGQSPDNGYPQMILASYGRIRRID